MYRILIACEDERMATGIVQVLDSNFAVECCGTAQWALELMNSFMPDVVVVSNGLADMDAFSLIRAMRLSGEHFGIILLTDISNSVITMHIKSCISIMIIIHIKRTMRQVISAKSAILPVIIFGIKNIAQTNERQ